jgi:uncharacterized protein (TIGR02246 family)
VYPLAEWRCRAQDTPMKKLLLIALLITCTVSLLSQGNKDEQTIRGLDKAWSQAADNKDLDKTVSYYADDASVLPFNSPIATGKDQIRQVWQHLQSAPGYSLTFMPTKIDVSKSHDIAYEIGTFELKMNDAQGKPTTTAGKYVVAWKKSPQGQWKVEADIFNTDK